MQREIKLRAWDKSEKRMLYRTIWDRNWYATPKNDESGCHCIREIMPGDQHYIILMQFTGLLDCKGVEIYEGDVVEYETGNDDNSVMQEEVRFEGGAFYPICEQSSETFKIIGNVYSNPALKEV